MTIRHLLSRPWTLRRLLRALDGIPRALDAQTAALTVQNQLLARLVDHLAPRTPALDAAAVQRSSGVDFRSDDELARAVEYIEKTQRTIGRAPSDDEVLRWLEDERTTDLATRLAARDAEIDRLVAEARS